MVIDYKILEERVENGLVVYQRVRFYGGEITTEDEEDIVTRKLVPVTRYRRTKVLEEREYKYDTEKSLALNYLNKELGTLATKEKAVAIVKQNTIKTEDLALVELKEVIVKEKPVKVVKV